MIGRTLSHYRILEKLGSGGMGEVYLAEDTELARRVALKVLPSELAREETQRRRLKNEAKSLAALNHPHIVTIYSVEEADGVHFITMELVPGSTLAELVPEKGFSLEEFFRIAVPLADAVAAAHRSGIVHRDLKPANIKLTPEGVLKVLDFGLAKPAPTGVVDPDAPTGSMGLRTEPGVVVGTVAYMSPEQSEGKPVDERSDVFSLGVVLYELLTGRRPFRGESLGPLLVAIQRDEPAPIESLRSGVPSSLRRILARSLEKPVSSRYPSAAELHRDLVSCRAEIISPEAALQTKRYRALPIGVALAALAAAIWLWADRSNQRWARHEALPEIARLGDSGDADAAFRLLKRAERYLPDDPGLVELKRIWQASLSIQTTPPGAEVFVRGYRAVDREWLPLGRTPIEEAAIPVLLSRARMMRPGYETREVSLYATPHAPANRQYRLEPEGTVPEAMVRVPGGRARLGRHAAVELGDYWIDKHEVTQREFQAFVDDGGYENEELWTRSFVDNGVVIEREEAMARFRDATGRPGPAGWEVGSFPEGEGELPVRGVSWYEASAYCSWRGKRLPTVYHWYRASGARGPESTPTADMLELANFEGEGPAPVGSFDSLGPFGTYDMPGNVTEWCWNEADGDRRFVAGGAWNDPSYRFLDLDAQSPFLRSDTTGLRCMRDVEPAAETSDDPSQLRVSFRDLFRDYERETPVGDELFSVFERLYRYDPVELDVTLEEAAESSSWTRETVSFRSGADRMKVHLFLPRRGAPPYHAVIYFPGYAAFFAGPGGGLEEIYWDFIVRAGRAVVVPQWQGTYGRGEERDPYRREANFHFARDLGRTLDYLETREDIDAGRVAYYGLSVGAEKGVILGAIERRLRALVLVGGALPNEELDPEVDLLNFAPRVRAPILMVNGRSDFFLDYENLQLPLFRLLGAADEDKRHAVFEAGHIPGRTELIREILDWLDRYLGAVR